MLNYELLDDVEIIIYLYGTSSAYHNSTQFYILNKCYALTAGLRSTLPYVYICCTTKLTFQKGFF